jgi:hypothetical protein
LRDAITVGNHAPFHNTAIIVYHFTQIFKNNKQNIENVTFNNWFFFVGTSKGQRK